MKLQRLKNIPIPPLWNQSIFQPALLNWLSKVQNPLFGKDFEESPASFENALKTALPDTQDSKLVSDFVTKLSRGSNTISIELLAALNQFQEKDLESLMKTLIAKRSFSFPFMIMTVVKGGSHGVDVHGVRIRTQYRRYLTMSEVEFPRVSIVRNVLGNQTHPISWKYGGRKIRLGQPSAPTLQSPLPVSQIRDPAV